MKTGDKKKKKTDFERERGSITCVKTFRDGGSISEELMADWACHAW